MQSKHVTNYVHPFSRPYIHTYSSEIPSMAQSFGDSCSPCDRPDIDEYCRHLKKKLFDSGDGSPRWDKDVILDFTVYPNLEN